MTAFINKLNLVAVEERETFIAEAICRAEQAGFRPAQYQRSVDWDLVARWAAWVRESGFAWKPSEDTSVDGLIVGPGQDGTRAIHSGQHRILGGLMGDYPVPESSLYVLGVSDPTRGWRDPVPTVNLADLLSGF